MSTIVRVSLHHPVSKTKGWQTRRMKTLVRRVTFGLAVAPVTVNGKASINGTFVHVNALSTCTYCTISFMDWSQDEIDAFVRFMKNAKDLSVELLSVPEPATMSA